MTSTGPHPAVPARLPPGVRATRTRDIVVDRNVDVVRANMLDRGRNPDITDRAAGPC
ncbi:hypothetical protein [Gordonia insulae]|uniref:hypothetical protein n=1 Tax=Gordonia insulae TaxID=2420509 RepID=UPI0013DDF658|nr:hypothetical protein [Gordonia insulae]